MPRVRYERLPGSPMLSGLADWLVTLGVLNNVRIIIDPEIKPRGRFVPERKEIVILDNDIKNTNAIRTSFLHELIHALQYSDIKPTTKTMIEEGDKLSELSILDKILNPVVLPRSFTQDKVSQPLTQTVPDPIYPTGTVSKVAPNRPAEYR